MKGDIGDTAIYFDTRGDSHQAVLTGESMNGNADLVYSDDDSWDPNSIRMAINTPLKDGSYGGTNVYELKPTGDWDQHIV